MLRAGYCTKMLPFKWNGDTYSVEVLSHINSWRVMGIGYLVLQWTLNTSGLYVLLTENHHIGDILYLLYMVFGSVLSSVIHLHAWVWPEDFAALLTSSFRFSRHFGLSTEGRDGMEFLLKLVIFGLVSFLPSLWVGNTFQVFRNAVCFSFFRSDSAVANVVVAFAWTLQHANVFLNSALFVSVALIYTNSCSLTLRKYR